MSAIGLSMVASPSLSPVQRILALLSTYEALFEAMAQGEPFDTAAVDPVFEQLRQVQRQAWPQGNALVDSIGLLACDLLHAADEAGPESSAVMRLLVGHRLAVRRARASLDGSSCDA